MQSPLTIEVNRCDRSRELVFPSSMSLLRALVNIELIISLYSSLSTYIIIYKLVKYKTN
jgi:hypothetical protein